MYVHTIRWRGIHVAVCVVRFEPPGRRLGRVRARHGAWGTAVFNPGRGALREPPRPATSCDRQDATRVRRRAGSVITRRTSHRVEAPRSGALARRIHGDARRGEASLGVSRSSFHDASEIVVNAAHIESIFRISQAVMRSTKQSMLALYKQAAIGVTGGPGDGRGDRAGDGMGKDLTGRRPRGFVRHAAAVVAVLACSWLLGAGPAWAQGRGRPDRYDETFRKYSKRYFGAGYDWRLFKAQ